MTNTSKIVVLAFLAACIAACSISVGTKTDLSTGLNVKWKGLRVEDAYLTSGDNKLTGREVNLGSKVMLSLVGVEGFTVQGGNVFPGASMNVTGTDGTAVLDVPDLFAKYDATGVSPGDAKNLSMTLTIGDPMVKGGKYSWTFRFWDKKGTGEITGSVQLTAK